MIASDDLMTVTFYPCFFVFKNLFNVLGLIWQKPEKWKEMRRFSTQLIKQFSNTQSETIIEDEAKILVKEIGKLRHSCDPHNLFTKAVCNIICSMCFSKR